MTRISLLEDLRGEDNAEAWRTFMAQQLDRPIAWVYKARFQVLRRLREQAELLADDVAARPR